MASGTASTSGPRPRTAGIPSARARIAACEVGPPMAVAIPLTTAGSNPAVSAGVSSAATTMPDPPSSARRAPSRWPSTPVLMLSRSRTRSRW